MSGSASSPSSSALPPNESGSPNQSTPVNQTSPPEESGSSPPLSSPPTPESSFSNSTTPDFPQPLSPPEPPPHNSSSSKTPPAPNSSSSLTPPPHPLNPLPPPLEPLPPPVPNQLSPPPPTLPPPSENSNSSLPPTTLPAPPVKQTPPPQPTPVPKHPSSPSQSSPARPQSPPATFLSPPAPNLPPGLPTPNPTPPTDATLVTPPGTTSRVPHTPHPVPKTSNPSTTSSSRSSNTSHSKGPSRSSNSRGAAPAAIVVGVLFIFLTLAVVFFVIVKKKKKTNKRKRIDHLINYHPMQDGHCNRTGPPSGTSVLSDPYYGAPHSATGNSSGSPSGGYGYQSDPSAMGNSRSWFTYEELTGITNGFSRENILGEGGFGCVYKGHLSDGREVAVKQLKAGSGQGEREFRAEVEIISRVHHRHLVSLVGYCVAEHHRLLVYEFVPNGTLEHHLHDKGQPVMDWSNRQKIAIGSAKGLAYLHEDCHPRIIHRDIKSANILMDTYFEAQVADFGLAKLTNDTNTHVSTRVMGTFGYMAPEYAASGKLTDRSDVFSFGVVLLELVTGRKPVDTSQPSGEESLVEWARPLMVQAIQNRNFQELVDPRLGNNYDKDEMVRMIEAAAACVRHSAPKRPRMMQVARALDSGGTTDLTNGVKCGQSTILGSGQNPNADIERLRRVAFDGEFSSDFGQTKSSYSSDSR